MNAEPKLNPRRCPEPGRPFVNREEEMERIEARLRVGVSGSRMHSVVVCFWGAYGMGKSWLLIELKRRHESNNRKLGGDYPTVAARLDLSRTILKCIWHDDGLDRGALVRELWKQLACQLDTDLPDMARASADEWARKFVDRVTEWSTKSVTPLILLDTVDDLLRDDEQTFTWLEQHLIERLALTDRVLLVFTSRGELRGWKSWHIRRRVDSCRLSAFDLKTAGREVGASPSVSEALYRHAFGHPLVTECLGTALEDRGINLRLEQEPGSLVEPTLARSLLTQVIGQILERVPELPRRVIRYACVLRWISVEPLRFLAKRGPKVAEADRGDAYYLDLIEVDLQAHHLVYWNGQKRQYVFDLSLRRLLTYDLELAEPAQFHAAHLAAFEFHREHLEQYPNYLALYVPELVYHRAILARCESQVPQPQAFQEWWEAFLEGDRSPAAPDPWIELVDALKGDEELCDLASSEYALLLAEAKKRAKLDQSPA